MSIKATSYPLQWPIGWRRMRAMDRGRARFTKHRSDLHIAEGLDRLLGELKMFGVPDRNVIVSTNVELTLAGYPRSGRRAPDDPGVAVYFMRDGKEQCIASDRYDRVADNLAAIAATIEAMRAIERHGGSQIIDRTFAGFAALPSPERPWRDVLGLRDQSVNRNTIVSAYKNLRSAAHPDKGGSPDAFDELTRAYEQALLENPE